MIIDAQQLTQESEIRGRVAIIGAGAAGITLAIELAKSFKNVVLLESGGLEFEQETQDLYKGTVQENPARPLDVSRLRYFGGTTNHWTGLCAPFDAVDFKPVADERYSGWPIQLADLMPYYERGCHYCEISAAQIVSATISQTEPIARQILDSSDFQLAEFQHSPPTRFGKRHRHDLEASGQVNVYLHANVTDISVSESGRAISSLVIRTLNGRKLKATADAFVLCCGGIENARVLLNCTSYFHGGIGNAHDLVGRFFMNNPMASVGNILPRDKYFDIGPMFNSGFEETDPVTVVFKNSADVSSRPGRRGASIFLMPLFEEDSAIAAARSSPSFEAVRGMLQDVRRGRIPTNLSEKACTSLEDPASIARAAFHRVTRLFRNKEPLKTIYARIEGAQRPNAASRVTLNDNIDALGMKKATLDWRITDEDYDNLYQSSVAFASGIGAAGFGRVNLEIPKKKDLSKVTGTGHHLGTTRMHNDPQQGVVDQNCRIHDLDNFFIAGSSVFPTGPRVNPTLTIVALAIRLADHLKTKLNAL